MISLPTILKIFEAVIIDIYYYDIVFLDKVDIIDMTEVQKKVLPVTLDEINDKNINLLRKLNF
jgi:hypothetical protein